MGFLKLTMRKAQMRVMAGLFALLAVAAMNTYSSGAQADNASRKMDLGIIVMPTLNDAQLVVKQLKKGTDFFVLAKERSIDATAPDGGYMGNLAPGQLRAELQDALKGLRVGDLSDVIHLPSGFAILKVLPVAPLTGDLNPKRISSLVSTGAIRYGAQVSGLGEADAALQDYAREDGWSRNLQRACELRGESLTAAKNSIRGYISTSSADSTDTSLPDQLQAHSALAQFAAKPWSDMQIPGRPIPRPGAF